MLRFRAQSSEKDALLATPSPEDVKMVMNILPYHNGKFHLWTPFRKTALNQWIDSNVTYTSADIDILVEKMQYNLFQTNKSGILSGE